MAQIQIELTGSNRKVVDKQIVDYMEKYPSNGYGTMINDPKYISERKLWVATGVRSNSCD